MGTNQISKLPDEINCLINLEKLSMSNNNLKVGHIWYLKVGHIWYLKVPDGTSRYLGTNQISKLPDEINCLTNLEKLSMSNNNLKVGLPHVTVVM